MNKYYTYNEITYNKGYILDKEDLYRVMEDGATSLESSQDAVESFINCVKTYNKSNDIEINNEEFEEVCHSCLLAEGIVFGVDIDFEKLFSTYKEMRFDEFLKYLFNIREAISICMLNEIGKKRIELEYSITLNEEVSQKLEDFKKMMEELFEFKNSENLTYKNLDACLDEYINSNLMNLQKNIISGNPMQVALDMLAKARL